MRPFALCIAAAGLLALSSGCAKHPFVQIITDPASRKAAIREHITLGVKTSAHAKVHVVHTGASAQWTPGDTLVVRFAPPITTVYPRSTR